MHARTTSPLCVQPNLDVSFFLHPLVLCLLLLLLILFACSTAAYAQSDPNATHPYAKLDRQSVTYRGPNGAVEKHSPGSAAVIGLIIPLKGPQASEGRALLAVAQLAIAEEQSLGPLPGGRQLQLVARDESGPWGQASTEILKLIEDDQALAIITSANGTTAHLAEQIANKISVPILTLSSDPSTTQGNVPWLFRLGPSDADQARVFCQRIYSDLGLYKVLLIAQMDHDGRVGAAEFEKAARDVKAAPPLRFEWVDSLNNLQSFQTALQTKQPDAIVIWTDAPAAEELMPVIQNLRPATPIFLCRKAAQLDTWNVSANPSVDSHPQTQIGKFFAANSSDQLQTATQSAVQQLHTPGRSPMPTLAAEDAYNAIHLIVAALRTTGANRVLLREYLANQVEPRDPNRKMPFDPAGNDAREFKLIRLNVPQDTRSATATTSTNP
ncbi:MAG: ABC transporter substrate-binding protein [Candidatus Acidiferrum sp.]